jgi:putative PIN family toxin of toxin-antitoxin system
VRIALDTNVYVSVFVFQSKRLGQMLNFIGLNHQIVMCSYVLDELTEVVGEKFPSKLAALDAFLTSIPFEYFYSPKILPDSLNFKIRDGDDVHVLYSAILSGADILVTGDKDFFDITAEALKKPEIMTPAWFMEQYMG